MTAPVCPKTVPEAVTQPWWPKAIDLELGLAKRPQLDVPHVPAGPVLDELHQVQEWVLWNQQGRLAARPHVWAHVPDYAFAGLKRYEKAHPKAKPAPQPQPAGGPAPTPLSRWTLAQVGGFLFRNAWLLTAGAKTGGYTPQQYVDRIRNAHEPNTGNRIWGASLQVNPGGAAGAGGDDNTAYWPAYRDALHAANLGAEVWFRADKMTIDDIDKIAGDLKGFDRWAFDIEVDWDRPENWDIPAHVAKTYPDIPRLVLIAGMPPNDPTVKTPGDIRGCLNPWIDNDFAWGTQAYAHTDWDGTPPDPGVAGGMEVDARWRGVQTLPIPPKPYVMRTLPMIAVKNEGCHSLKEQLSAVEMFQGNYGIEWFETCEDDDLALCGI